MITGIAKLLGRGLRGTGSLIGKGTIHGASFASRLPAWYIKRLLTSGSIKNKLANIGNFGMFYKRNKRRWHDAIHAGELIHPYSYY